MPCRLVVLKIVPKKIIDLMNNPSETNK